MRVSTQAHFIANIGGSIATLPDCPSHTRPQFIDNRDTSTAIDNVISLGQS